MIWFDIRMPSASSSSLRSSLELSDTRVSEPYIRALLGTASHFCEVLVPQSRIYQDDAAGEAVRNFEVRHFECSGRFNNSTTPPWRPFADNKYM